jgi:hypothetical protein
MAGLSLQKNPMLPKQHLFPFSYCASSPNTPHSNADNTQLHRCLAVNQAVEVELSIRERSKSMFVFVSLHLFDQYHDHGNGIRQQSDPPSPLSPRLARARLWSSAMERFEIRNPTDPPSRAVANVYSGILVETESDQCKFWHLESGVKARARLA